MRLGLMIGYWMSGPEDPIDLVLEAERLGFDSVWTAEAYGSDAFSPLCWIGARTTRIKLGTGIMQISARTPACVAMTATTIDHLSGGRLILGIGVSGPQVVEGWYGQPFPKPMARTREFVALLRTMLRREGPVSFDGRALPAALQGWHGSGQAAQAHHPSSALGDPDLPRRRRAEERGDGDRDRRRLAAAVHVAVSHRRVRANRCATASRASRSPVRSPWSSTTISLRRCCR